LSGDANREKSPTVATIEMATAMSTTGDRHQPTHIDTVQSHSGQLAVEQTEARHPRSPTAAKSASTARASSAGNGWGGQPPAAPCGRTDLRPGTGAGGLRANTACTWFLQPGPFAARCRPAGRPWRRNARVSSSASHTDGRQSARQQLGQDPGVDLVGLDLRLSNRPGSSPGSTPPPADSAAPTTRRSPTCSSWLQRHLVVHTQRGREGSKSLR